MRTAASELHELLQEASKIQLTRDALEAFSLKCRLRLKKYRPDVIDDFERLAKWPMDAPIVLNPGQKYQPPADNSPQIVSRIRDRLTPLLKLVAEDAALSEIDALASSPPSVSEKESAASPRKVFVVHGHNRGLREEVARFVERLDLEAVILDEQPGKGRALIEKFEDSSSDIAFAIVIMTADDLGNAKDLAIEHKLEKRARQNVIFELGYFVAKLGRGRVAALYENGVEIPTDYGGVEWLPIDRNWQTLLAGELKAAGLNVDANRLLRK